MAESDANVAPASFFNIFRVSLTREQQIALTNLLPRAYSFQPYKCTRSLDEQSMRSQPLKPAKKKKELKDPDYSVPYVNKMKEAPTVKVDSTQAIPGGEPFLECYLILKRLKKSMYAWPFKTPVDPKALGIPEYLNVVQEPMDLKTIEDTLRRQGYAHPGQFHRDMYKMLMNSYKFNQKNSEVFSNTVEFEEEYLRLSKQARQGKLLAAEKKKTEGLPQEETPTLSKDKPQSSVEHKPPRQYNKKPKPEKIAQAVKEQERGKVKVEESERQEPPPLPSFSQLFDDFKTKQEELVDFSDIFEPKQKNTMREQLQQSVSNDVQRKPKDGRGRGQRKSKQPKEKNEMTQSLKQIKELKEVTQVENQKNVVMLNIQKKLSDLLRRLNQFQFSKPKQRPSIKPEGQHPNFNNFSSITTSEKKKLAQRISLLPPTELKYVIQICFRNRPKSKDDDVYEIDLEKTDPKTLKQLSNFVAMRTKHAKRGPKAKSDSSKAAPSQAAMEQPQQPEEMDEERYEVELGMDDERQEQSERSDRDVQSPLGLVLQHPGDDIHSHMLQQNFNFSVAELLQIEDNGPNSDDYQPEYQF